MTGPDLPSISNSERERLRRGLMQAPPQAARFLLGQILVRRIRGRSIAVKIVETEAYLGVGDAAAHAYRGRTPRTEPLWGPPGTLYVYLIYGIYYCLNVTVEPEGIPGCVLIRAADPLPESGLHRSDCCGPGRLCRALGIDTRLTGRSALEEGPLFLREGAPPQRIGVSTRIGIQKAADRPLRFFDENGHAVSRHPGLRARASRRAR
jgi:DNA-3-methyladenine glycosylase